jgi:hypothetical protein
MISEITNISSQMATDMYINEVKYSILSIILICLFVEFFYLLMMSL